MRLLRKNTGIMKRIIGGVRGNGLRKRLRPSCRHFCAVSKDSFEKDLDRDELFKHKMRKHREKKVQEIPPAELRQQFIISFIPMFGFGFMDNTILIYVGDYIDFHFGATFALSTLTAAAFGQVISDSSGTLFGGVIDAAAAKVGVRQPRVTPEQRLQTKFRYFTTGGSLLGVIFGCFAGMINLLFLDLKKRQRMEEHEKLEHIFKVVMERGPNMFDCEAVSMFLYDPEDDVLWTKVATTVKEMIEIPVKKKSVCSYCYNQKTIVKVDDAYNSEWFDKSHDKKNSFQTQNLVAAPVLIGDKCVAVVEILNKKGEGQCFDDDDVKMLQMLTRHVALFMEMYSYHQEDMVMLKEDSDFMHLDEKNFNLLKSE